MNNTKSDCRAKNSTRTAAKRAVLVGGLELSGSDAGCWQGICRYAHAARNWLIHDAGIDWSGLDRIMSEEPILGIIAGIRTPEIAQNLRATALPIVSVSAGAEDGVDQPHVGIDDRRTGALVADYFADRRFRHFGVIPSTARPANNEKRIAGYRDALSARGFKIYELDPEARTAGGPAVEATQAIPSTTIAFDKVPKPLAVFAIDDFVGRMFCRACARHGLRVPEDVAVMGTGDFEIICDSAFPPLSSVRIPMQQVGYSAARMLDQFITGKPPAEQTLLLPPVDVHTRQSSDVMAVGDPVMAKALAFIREHSAQRISSDDVVKHCKVHRRLLERRFRAHMDRTILDEIQRVRTDRAISLLMDSNEPMGKVARSSGFRNQDHMGKVFRVIVGRHPRDFRRAFQIR